jgi:large conductance mechanosensitive channel
MGNATPPHLLGLQQPRKPLHRMVWDLFVVENVLGLSIALVSAVLLNQVVQYLLDGILFPLIGWKAAGKPLRELYISLNGVQYASLVDAQNAGAPVVTWGAFLEALCSFLLCAFVVFVSVCAYRRFKGNHHQKPATAEQQALRMSQALGVKTAQISQRTTERDTGGHTCPTPEP